MSEGQLKGTTRAKVAAQAEPQSQVRVLYGVHAIEANLTGRAVGDVRQALRQALNISPQAVAVVDGREVEEGFILLAGQQLEFVRLAGEKGFDPPLTCRLVETWTTGSPDPVKSSESVRDPSLPSRSLR